MRDERPETASNRDGVRLLHDPEPRTAPPGDAFGSKDLAARLAKVVLAAEPPFTVSISGEWGVGKTALTEQMMEFLPKGFVVARLDLWAQDPATLTRSLAVELGTQLNAQSPEQEPKERERVADNIDQEIRRAVTKPQPPELSGPSLTDVWKRARTEKMRSLVIALFVLDYFLVLGVASLLGGLWSLVVASLTSGIVLFFLFQSGLVLSIRTASESLAPTREAVFLEQKIKTLSARTLEDPRQVLIVLDNLDRLSGDDAVKVLSELRAFLEVPRSRCVFLIPIDRMAFVRHLRSRMADDDQAARDYLDKFFNLDVFLSKPVAMDLRAWARDLAESVFEPAGHTGGSGRDYSSVAEVVAAAADGSPRTVTRLVNDAVALYWTLDDETQHVVSLEEVTWIACLIARFPQLLESLTLDPRQLADTRSALRDALGPEARTQAVTAFLDASLGPVQADDRAQRSRAALTSLLREFLLRTDQIDVSVEHLSAALALRGNRIWRGIPRTRELRAALASGLSDEFAAELGEAGVEERPKALAAAAEEIDNSVRNHFWSGAVRGVNAIASLLDPGSRDAARVRRSALDVIRDAKTAAPYEFSADAMAFIFDPRHVTNRARQALDWVIGELGRLDAPSLVVALKTAREWMSTKQVSDAQASLGKVPDDHLTPLYEPGQHADLLAGPASLNYVQRLAGWQATELASGPAPDATAPEIAASRIVFALGNGGWTGGDFDSIASQLAPQVPTVPGSGLSVVTSMVDVLTHAPASAAIDQLAAALAVWAADPSAGLDLALRLPTQSAVPQVQSAANAFLGSAPPSDGTLVAMATTHRETLRNRYSIDVGTELAGRWGSSSDIDYARLTIADGDRRSAAALVSVLNSPAAGDDAQFVNLTAQGCQVFADSGDASSADQVVALVAARLATLGAAVLPSVGNALAPLAPLGRDASPLVAAMARRVDAMTTAEVANVSLGVQNICISGLPGTEMLPARLVDRFAALSRVDTVTSPWLIKQPGIAATARSAWDSAIREASEADVVSMVPVPETVRTGLSRSSRLYSALIWRAHETPTLCRPLLHEALQWNLPLSKREKAEAGQLLTEILDKNAGDAEIDGLVKRLRVARTKRESWPGSTEAPIDRVG